MIKHSFIPLFLMSVSLAACSTWKPPAITYDSTPHPATLQPEPPKPVQVVEVPRLLPLPDQLKPLPDLTPSHRDAADPRVTVAEANKDARIEPSQDGYINAVQIYPFSDSALYQVYAAPSEVTDIALQAGEQLVGSGPVAAGDTVRWVIGNAESGTGATKRIHILLKPTQKGLTTNLVINTDRRTYHLELRAVDKTYMASVSFNYPQDELIALKAQNTAADQVTPIAADVDLSQLSFRYDIKGDNPPWRPLRAMDNGKQVFIQFPAGIGQGEMPPLIVIGGQGNDQIPRYRVNGNYMIVDGLFAAAELRLGTDPQAIVRIVRNDGEKTVMSEDANNNHEPAAPSTPSPAPPEARPHEMRLHPGRPPVTRLSRKVLLGLSVAGTLVILAALGVALWPHAQAPQSESVNTGNRNTPEGLAGLPKDYAELAKAAPKIGPPLPGDLGKPMLNAGVTPPPMPQPQLTPDQQRIVQEQDAARTSHLFAINNTAPAPQSAAPASPSGNIPQANQTSSDPTSTENMQENKIAFANSVPDPNAVSPARVQHPASPYVLQAGWVINAALAKGMNSDLPGDIHAQVTQNVYDSPTGRYLLIPQGSMLEGKYNSQVSFGQTRMQMVWTRLILPNGNWISLGHLPGADGEGFAGAEDGVDEHWGSIFKAALLSTVLSVGAEAGTSDTENNLAQAIRAGASQSINQAGEQIVERNLNIQPTLTARFGLPVTVTVDQDLILEPYGQEAQR